MSYQQAILADPSNEGNPNGVLERGIPGGETRTDDLLGPEYAQGWVPARQDVIRRNTEGLGMKQTPQPAAGRAPGEQPTQARKERGDREAMSTSMRQLIISFVEDDSERAWDPTVYSRRVDPAR